MPKGSRPRKTNSEERRYPNHAVPIRGETSLTLRQAMAIERLYNRDPFMSDESRKEWAVGSGITEYQMVQHWAECNSRLRSTTATRVRVKAMKANGTLKAAMANRKLTDEMERRLTSLKNFAKRLEIQRSSHIYNRGVEVAEVKKELAELGNSVEDQEKAEHFRWKLHIIAIVEVKDNKKLDARDVEIAEEREKLEEELERRRGVSYLV